MHKLVNNIKSLIWSFFNWLNRYIAAPRMIMGYKQHNGLFRPHTRISNTTSITAPEKLTIGDHVFIGHHTVLDCSNNVTIGDGCQICTNVLIINHSSHTSIRLYGRHYIGNQPHIGYVTGAVCIGEYSFIGPYSTIMPDCTIGKGSIVTAYSLVKGKFPDFAIIAGNPAVIVGDTRKLDEQYLINNPELREYYNEWTNK
jgi:acetyltransferase-like isoleucine patch superfamily enzyme